MRNGYGEQHWNNGCSYKGYWLNDKMHGFGQYNKCIGNSQSIYKGYFHKGKKEGLGQEEYRDGRIYQGQFKANKKHGMGKVYGANTYKEV